MGQKSIRATRFFSTYPYRNINLVAEAILDITACLPAYLHPNPQRFTGRWPKRRWKYGSYVALFQYSVDLGPGEVPQYEKNCSSKPSPTLFLHDCICIRVFNGGGCCATLFQDPGPPPPATASIKLLPSLRYHLPLLPSFRPSVLPVSFAREQ